MKSVVDSQQGGWSWSGLLCKRSEDQGGGSQRQRGSLERKSKNQSEGRHGAGGERVQGLRRRAIA
eukprot:4318880-Pleurochrysis_carterae.AAC.1